MLKSNFILVVWTSFSLTLFTRLKTCHPMWKGPAVLHLLPNRRLSPDYLTPPIQTFPQPLDMWVVGSPSHGTMQGEGHTLQQLGRFKKWTRFKFIPKRKFIYSGGRGKGIPDTEIMLLVTQKAGACTRTALRSKLFRGRSPSAARTRTCKYNQPTLEPKEYWLLSQQILELFGSPWVR